MDDFNLSLTIPPDAEMKYNGTNYNTELLTVVIVRAIVTFSISLWGFVGNAIVIWLLGFCIKRNPFTTYVVNLAVADFGVVTAAVALNIYWLADELIYIYKSHLLAAFLHTLFLFMFSASQLLLLFISIDRCVCVFFPLWHRCHRPPYLSTILCAIIWIFTFLLSVSDAAISLTTGHDYLWNCQFLLNVFICTPIMTISTMALLIKICLISQRYKRRKLLTAILLTLLFFFFFTFPMNAIQYLSNYAPDLVDDPYSSEYAFFGVYLNSTVNPLIYFLIGRKKKDRSGKRVKKILERLFKEDEEGTKEMEFSGQIQLR